MEVVYKLKMADILIPIHDTAVGRKKSIPE